MDCGHDELAGAVEHPVVRRLRHRRLLAFLRHQGLDATFGSCALQIYFPSLSIARPPAAFATR